MILFCVWEDVKKEVVSGDAQQLAGERVKNQLSSVRGSSSSLTRSSRELCSSEWKCKNLADFFSGGSRCSLWLGDTDFKREAFLQSAIGFWESKQWGMERELAQKARQWNIFQQPPVFRAVNSFREKNFATATACTSGNEIGKDLNWKTTAFSRSRATWAKTTAAGWRSKNEALSPAVAFFFLYHLMAHYLSSHYERSPRKYMLILHKRSGAAMTGAATFVREEERMDAPARRHWVLFYFPAGLVLASPF